MRSARSSLLASWLLLSGSLVACAGTDRALPLADFVPVAAVPSAEIASEPEPFLTASTDSFSRAEIAYIESTAGAVCRRRASERATGFVDPPGGGYGICLRSPRKGGDYDLAMLVLQRRLDGTAISQVDDDTIVLRRAGDTARCASAALRFVTARRG